MAVYMPRILFLVRTILDQRQQRRLLNGGPSLKTLLFHGVYDGESSGHPEGVDNTVFSDLKFIERCIRETLEQGYRFIHADDLGAALVSHSRLALLTFDDGYANNRLLLPMLRRLGIPALVFVATDFMLRQRSFWWDVLARETKRRCLSGVQLSAMRRELKRMPAEEIEASLMSVYGESCFNPQFEHDRPLTVDELADFARDPLIQIGNHTHRHALLDQCSSDVVHRELSVSQKHLTDILGKTPTMLAYPNGRWNKNVVRVAAELGLQHAFTTERALSALPLSRVAKYRIPRLMPVQDFPSLMNERSGSDKGPHSD